MPNARLASSVPASDWNIRSIGQPRSSAFICTVTCESTQFCVGIALRLQHVVDRGEDLGGRLRRVGRRVDADHRVAAAVRQALAQRREDALDVVGRVVGLQRDDSRPGSPSVLLARTTTWNFAPTVIRSKFDISFARGRGHLGRQARRDGAQRRAASVSMSSSHSRNWPTREVRDRAIRLVVELVLDDPRELVVLVRHDRVLAQLARASGRRAPRAPRRARPHRAPRCRRGRRRSSAGSPSRAPP